MFPNILIVLLLTIVPLFIGFIYYNNKVFGKAWMKSASLTEEKLKGSNMLIIFIATFFFSFLISFFLFGLVVHQTDIYSLLVDEKGFGEEGSAVMNTIKELMDAYGDNYRTFKHGALHGSLIGIFIVFPIISINTLFERRPFKYSLIHTGYWTVCLAIMGGVLCQWG